MSQDNVADPNPTTLLEKTVQRWTEVREENQADRGMVTSEDWNAWKRAEKQITRSLVDVVEASEDGLKPEDIRTLEDVNRSIDQAKRLTGDALRQYAQDNFVGTRTDKKTRNRLMKMLRR